MYFSSRQNMKYLARTVKKHSCSCKFRGEIGRGVWTLLMWRISTKTGIVWTLSTISGKTVMRKGEGASSFKVAFHKHSPHRSGGRAAAQTCVTFYRVLILLQQTAAFGAFEMRRCVRRVPSRFSIWNSGPATRLKIPL